MAIEELATPELFVTAVPRVTLLSKKLIVSPGIPLPVGTQPVQDPPVLVKVAVTFNKDPYGAVLPGANAIAVLPASLK
jgi:hypothetical protein